MTFFRTATLFSFLSLITCIIYLYYGNLVFRLNMRSKINRQFFLLCLSLAEWSLAFSFFYDAPSKESAWFWYRVAIIGLGTYEVLALQFFFALTKIRKTAIIKAINILVYIPFILQLVTISSNKSMITDVVSTRFGWVEVFATSSPVLWIHIINVLFCISFGLILALIWCAKTTLPHEKKQAKLIFVFGLLSFVFGTANNIILPVAHIIISPSLGQVFILLFIFAISYSIKNFNLMTLTAEIAANEIISKITDLLVLTDQCGIIIKTNKPVEEILGYKENELIGKSFNEIVEEQAFIGNITDKIGHWSVSTMNMELNYRTKDNGLIPVNVSMSSIADKNGFVLGMATVAHDMRPTKRLQNEVRERMRIAQSLIVSNEKLKELDKVKSDFISTVSHELRTPLTSVLGFAKIIKKKFEDIILTEINTENKKALKAIDQIQANIDIIVSEGERLTALINDVLDIAKIEEGKMEWKMERLSVSELIDSATAVTASLFEPKGLELKKNLAADLPEVLGDRNRLIQVLVNLISNAVKFTDAGVITCDAVQKDGMLQIGVADTGIGIAEENLTLIFEKFRQVGDTMTDKPKGTGLGLPICKYIIEHHGGNIFVESRLGHGSKFYITIPAVMEADRF